jgi:hypothetical protein
MHVRCKAFNDLCAPPHLALALQDFATNLPVQKDELAVHSEDSVHLSSSKPPLEVSPEFVVAFRVCDEYGPSIECPHLMALWCETWWCAETLMNKGETPLWGPL